MTRRQDLLCNPITSPDPLLFLPAVKSNNYDEMDQCRLPVEVCERIIDSISYGLSRFHFPSYLRDLRACALTCRNWLPRSRLNLYRCVWFQERGQLERVSQTIADHPFLGAFVQELFLGSPDPRRDRTRDPKSIALPGRMRLFIEGWFASENEGPPTRGPLTKGSPTKDPPTKDQYIPFAQDTIVRALQNVRVLTISHFHWHALPHRYHVTAAQYPIVELSIIGGYFNTFADLLRVVWAFRHLRTLRLIDVEFERVSRTNLESISLNRPRVCHELTDLYVVGQVLPFSTSFLPCGCFGTNIIHLTLSWVQTYSIDMNHHVPYLRSLPRLQELTWRVDRSWAPWESKYLTKFSSYVGATLVGLHQDSTLARLTLQFEPQGISNIGRNAYMRRTDFLRDVLSPDFVNILRRTQRVHHLQLIVPEPKRAENNADLWKDASWWKKQVATYMLRTKVAVHVDISVTDASKVWDLDRVDEMYWQGGVALSFGGKFGYGMSFES